MKYNTLAVALGLSATQVAAQRINKDALWGNLDWTHNVLRSLPGKNYNVRYWSLNDISQTCYDTAKREGVDPRAMRQHSVTYGDCDQEWYVCVEDGINASDVAREFSRIPVRMRQWVGDVVAFKKGGGAWAWVNQITLFGGAATTPVMLHEATHCVDLNDGFYSMQSGWQGMGDPKEWVDTINRDSAVPDNYAQNNPTENLAQFPALIIYDRVTGRLGQEQPQLPRIGHQLQKVSDQSDWNSAWGGGILDYSGNLRCTRRWEHPRAVWPDSGKPVYTRRTANGTFEGSPESKPNVPKEKATIYIAPEPLELKAKFAPTNCSIH